MTSCSHLRYCAMNSKFCTLFKVFIVDDKPHPECSCTSCETIHEETQGELDVPQSLT